MTCSGQYGWPFSCQREGGARKEGGRRRKREGGTRRMKLRRKEVVEDIRRRESGIEKEIKGGRGKKKLGVKEDGSGKGG